MHTIALVSTHFLFYYCFVDMNCHFHPWEQEFHINSLDHSTAKQLQWLLSAIRYDMAFCMGESEN